MDKFNEIRELLNNKADYQARLKIIPYDGSPEIKERGGGKYLYMRKREIGKLTSTYVGPYTEELYQLLIKNAKESKELNKNIRHIEKRLAELGYENSDLSPTVELNLNFARDNMKLCIYEQAVLEGVATTFPQTETVIDNGKVSGMTPSDIQKILNLKHAWEFILDKDVIQSPSDYPLLSYIAKFVNEGFYKEGGRIRAVPVSIGGSTYVPPIPMEFEVKEEIKKIVSASKKPIDIAIKMCLYCMKAQIFNDGNKRAAVIFANHYLISKGGGLMVIPEKEVPKFKRLLVAYYEGKDIKAIQTFMKDKCWRKF